MPFDLAVHLPNFIPMIISSEFTNYLSDIRNDGSTFFELYFKSGFFSKPKKMAWLNHDTDLEGDRNKLVERYRQRIKNFQDAIKKRIPTIFIQACEVSYNTTKLTKVLKENQCGNPHKIIYIDIGANLIVKSAGNIHIIKSQLPYNNYVWHSEEHKNSDQGRLFENKIIEELHQIIKEFVN